MKRLQRNRVTARRAVQPPARGDPACRGCRNRWPRQDTGRASGILVSRQIADICSDEFLFRRIDCSQPKGAGKPLDVFELLGLIDGPEEYRVNPAVANLVQINKRSMKCMPARIGCAPSTPWRRSPLSIPKTWWREFASIELLNFCWSLHPMTGVEIIRFRKK